MIHFRNAVTLGTGLTALFLLVRCSLPERDYSELGIGGENAGSGGGSGSGPGGAGGAGTGGTSAGQGGLGGPGDAGGQGGATLVEPVPCVASIDDAGIGDAGVNDAGLGDAGLGDAGLGDAGTNPCECVDGFIRAVDADDDGEGSRECSVSPGLDCDDGDGAITHNSCGGCTALANTIGEDCLDCGAYICAGPDALACASKPSPTVVDPDCRCQDASIVARDTDEDGWGTRLCEVNPGIDCDDGDNAFITNECGGCQPLAGTVGEDCNQCGVYACNGTALACVPSGVAGGRCLNTTTRQTCVGNGFWGADSTCGNVCYEGNCEICTPGTFQCGPDINGSHILYRCGLLGSSNSLGIGWGSYDSCLTGQTCNEANGTCTGYLLLPRDQTFDVLPVQRRGVPWHDVLNTASDSDYG